MIKIVMPEKAAKVIDSRKPMGQFLVLNKDAYTAIDNSNGEAWTEDFRNLKNCLMFLNGANLEDCLELEER